MKELMIELQNLRKNTHGDTKVIQAIEKENAAFPFSIEGRLLTYYLSIGELSYEKYSQLNAEYYKRNKYIHLFEMSPRTYGQIWGEQHILSLFPQFIKASKENLSVQYPTFDGEFDLWLDGIRVEVKACRAASDKNKSNSLVSRAYLHTEAKKAGFKYHFQQLKPSCCDVFIWIGTCRDELLYWVLTSEELLETGKLGTQHRNINTGLTGVDVFEGQVFMTEDELAPFQVTERDLLQIVREKGTL